MHTPSHARTVRATLAARYAAARAELHAPATLMRRDPEAIANRAEQRGRMHDLAQAWARSVAQEPEHAVDTVIRLYGWGPEPVGPPEHIAQLANILRGCDDAIVCDSEVDRILREAR